MATTVYGAWQGAASSGKVTQRAYLTYTVIADTADTYTINVSASGVDPWNSKWSSVTVDYTWGATDYSTGSGQQVKTVSTSDLIALVGSRNYTYTKGHSAVLKTVFATTTLNHVSSSGGGSAVNGKTSTASVSFSVSARTSYTVSFNANGGSGAPANQVKWYNETLTLSTAIPTRANYIFKGWGTSSTATTISYSPGASYTENAALTLYAIWEKVYIAPIIESIDVHRTETSSSTAVDEEGNYMIVTLKNYSSGNVPADGANQYKTTTITLKIIVNGTSYTLTPMSPDTNTFTGTGTNKTIHYAVPTVGYTPSYPTSDSYSITLTLSTSGYSSVVYSTVLMSAIYPIDIDADATFMALGIPTRVKQDMYIQINEFADVSTLDGKFVAALTTLGWNTTISNGGVYKE